MAISTTFPLDTIRIIQITQLDDLKADQAKEVLYEGFKDDLVSNCLVAGREDLRRITYDALVRAGIIGGQMYVAVDEKDSVVGTACWYPPGSDFLSDDKQRAQGSSKLFETLQKEEPDLYTWWMNVFLPKCNGVTEKLLGTGKEGSNFKMDNWNIYSLTTLPDWRGRGIARRLLKVGEDKVRVSASVSSGKLLKELKAAAEGCCVTFEADNENNIALYRHWGYILAGAEYIEGTKGVPGYSMSVMYKRFDAPASIPSSS